MVYTTIEPFVIGGMASCTAEVFTFPIDLTKTRLQIQGQKLENISIKYKGMFHCFKVVLKEEGMSALFSGYFIAACQPCRLFCSLFNLVCLIYYQNKASIASTSYLWHTKTWYISIFKKKLRPKNW